MWLGVILKVIIKKELSRIMREFKVMLPFAAVVLMACPAAPGDTMSAGDACTADADCLVTNFPGCCACPQCSTADPVARSRTAAAQAEAACAAASCDASICDVAGMCPPGEPAAHFTPRCCAGVCVGARAVASD